MSPAGRVTGSRPMDHGYSARDLRPGSPSPTVLGSGVRSQVRGRRPECSGSPRPGVPEPYAGAPRSEQWPPRPGPPRRRSMASAHQSRDLRTGARRRLRRSRGRLAAVTPSTPCRSARARSAPAASSPSAPPSPLAASAAGCGRCGGDVRSRGAVRRRRSGARRLPGPRGAAPGVRSTARRRTSVDSGRNCSEGALGSLISHDLDEIRFAGATWDLGGGLAASRAWSSRPPPGTCRPPGSPSSTRSGRGRRSGPPTSRRAVRPSRGRGDLAPRHPERPVPPDASSPGRTATSSGPSWSRRRPRRAPPAQAHDELVVGRRSRLRGGPGGRLTPC